MDLAHLEPAAHEALRLFRSIFSAARNHFQSVENHCGATGAQIWMLAVLDDHPGMRVTELASTLAIHPSTASNLLAKAEKSGLVVRHRSREDQRVVQLYLTDTGRTVLCKAPQPLAGMLPDALSRLPDSTLDRLSRDLKCLADAMGLKGDDRHKPLSEL